MHVLMMTQRVDPDHDVLGFTVDWIRRLAERVEKLTVLTAYAGDHNLPDDVTIRSYGKERGYSKSRRVLAFQRHCLQLRSNDVDVAFVHMIPQYVLASWPLLGRDRPYLMWYAHGTVGWDTRMAHRIVDQVVTPTGASYRIDDSSKVDVVGHGIDMDRFTPGDVSSDRDLLLSVGRVSPIKNTHVIVDALERLRERDVDALLRIVAGESRSDTAYLERVRSQVSEAGLEETVTFVGSVPHHEIVREYRRAGAFLNASRTGSLDKTEVEAMACGTPVLSCNDSFVEMVRETDLEESLLTFPPGDSDALADRIADLATRDEDEYRRLCRDCRSVVSTRHGLDALMDAIVRRLHELVASR